MKKFTLQLSIFTLLPAAILVWLSNVSSFQPVMYFAWICLAVYYLITLLTFYMASRNMQGRFQNFMNIFFLGIIIKLFVTGTLVIIYKTSQGSESGSLAFALPFAAVYFSFLAFETIYLAKLSRNQSKSE